MRIILPYILILSLLLCGCYNEEEQKTVLFYYPRANYTQNSVDSVIAPEAYNREDFSSITLLLDQYFLGPRDPLLRNPFPEDVSVVEVSVLGNVTLVTLTDTFAQLNGLDFALACASISRTVSGITGTPMVQLDCETIRLNGNKHFTITPGTILYLDNVPSKEESLSTEE